MAYEISKHFLDHLAGQFELGQPILFTGAGFSRDAANFHKQKLPGVEELKKALWEICFPGEPYDHRTTLANLYGAAIVRHANKVTEELTRILTVNPDSLPDWYKRLFSFPWAKCYTLNIDDLATAAARRFDLQRPPRAISALDLTASIGDPLDSLRHLLVVHLNGIKDKLPDGVTFSPNQYADRLARQDPWYLTLVSEILTRPFVFIGTTLEEPPLWQHVELRQHKGGRALRELRPRSYLVTPTLDRARQALLADHHVEWIPLTAEQFVRDILEKITGAAAKGNALITEKLRDRSRAVPTLPEVSLLATNPLEKTEYLLGAEPIWADIQSGRAIIRESDRGLAAIVKSALSTPAQKPVIAITGTAGSGKSTALMRVSLLLSAEGIRVGWIDRNSEIGLRQLRDAMSSDNGPPVLAIDDTDLFGHELSSILREIATNNRFPLVIISIRSGRFERVVNPTILGDVKVVEQTQPHLTDNDIAALLDSLDKENRLGFLKGKPPDQQFRLFQQQSGRQLLVAMIQATSNDRFELKATSEFDDLSPESKVIYAMVAVASSFRFGLTRDELVIGAGGDNSNVLLNQIDTLSRRHVIVVSPSGELTARHRVIADIIVDGLRRSGALVGTLNGVALVAASKVTQLLKRSARAWRLLRSVINHDYLLRMIGPENARNLYGSLEGIISWDFQFWLQRGSLEVECGDDLSLAENFLKQAMSLNDSDPFIQNEYAYLLFRRAGEDPRDVDARDLVNEASSILNDLILRRGHADPYPYHVLGSQGLMWARRGITDPKEKDVYLRKLLAIVSDGIKKFSHRTELQQLHEDLKREHLSIAVRK